MIAILCVISFIILPLLSININKILVFTVLISHVPIILVPYYKGIFYNPNSLGTTAATIFAVALIIEG